MNLFQGIISKFICLIWKKELDDIVAWKRKRYYNWYIGPSTFQTTIKQVSSHTLFISTSTVFFKEIPLFFLKIPYTSCSICCFFNEERNRIMMAVYDLFRFLIWKKRKIRRKLADCFHVFFSATNENNS